MAKHTVLSAFADEADESLSGQTAALKRNGLRFLDVRMIDGVNVKDFSQKQCKEYAKVLSGEGIGVNCIGSPLGKADITALNFDRCSEAAKRVFENARIFGTDKIRVFAFYKAENAENKIFAYMNGLVDLARSYGVTLYCENEEGLYNEKAGDTVKLLDNVPGLENIFDAGNYVLSGQDITEAVALLGNRTTFYHIKDAAYGKQITPAGEGDGRIADILQNAAENIILTLEPHLYDFSGLNTLAAHKLTFKYDYATPQEAFDAGAAALRKLIAG